MNQDINFLDALPKPKVVYTTFMHATAVWGISVAALVGLSFYQGHALTAARNKVVAAESSSQQMVSKLKAIGRHEKEGKVISKELIALIDKDLSDHQEGFYQSLQELTTRVNPGLWLNNIALDRSDKSVRFRGSALKAGDVYVFIDHLKSMPSYSGRYFNVLTLEQEALKRQTAGKSKSKTAEAGANNKAESTSNGASEERRFIRFVLQTRDTTAKRGARRR